MKVFGGLTRTAIQAVLLASVGFGSIAIAAPGDTTRVSVSSSGQQGDKASHFPSISADGRFVAFTSGASNLVHGDTNSLDVFVHDRQTGVTTRVNVNSRGGQGNWYSGNVSISGDGRIVAFDGGDSNLVDGDTNNANDVFVHDRHTGMTTRVSVNSRGTQGDDSSDFPSISADGRFVAFRSLASNLVDDDTNGTWDVFVHDRQTGNTTRVSVHSSGAQGGNQNNVHVSVPSISADGRFVAFSSFDELVDGVTTSFPSIFVHDRQTAATTMVSMDSRGAQLGGQQPSISADGRFVAFKSNGIFVHDRENGMTTRVDATPPGKLISSPSISADGRFVAFDADASNLADGATKYLTDVFVHDRQIGNTTRVSVNSRGTQGNNRSNSPSISADGRFVAFHSDASNLVDGDTNGMSDVFVHEMAIAQNTAQGLTPSANLQRQFPETYAAIWEIPSVSNVTKETAITALETMITLAYSPEMNDLMWSRLGVNAADLVGWATKNPQRAVALSGKEIGWNLAVSAAISVSAALVADSLFATQPMASVPQSWQNPLKALVRATIIEVAGLAHAASNPAAIVGPLVNRLIDVVEIYKASRALTKVIDQALVATALGLETAAQLAVDFPNARSQRVAEDTVADLLGRVREFVGEDDEAAVQQIGALTYAALISQRRGDLQTARGLVVQIQREGKLSSNIHPFSAITKPVDWLTAVARAGRDTPEQAANIMITATALRDLLADSLAIDECRKQLVTVSIDESKCGYSLTKDGVVKFQEQHLFRFDQVSADIGYVLTNSGEKVPYGTNTRIMLFPQSPSGRFHIIDACHYECGDLRLLDSHIGTTHRFSAGKYGPYPDISWGPDERLAGLFSSNEGFSQIHIVNTQTGQRWSFPDWGSATDDASQLILETQQLVWVDPTTFYVDARFCTALKPSTRCDDFQRLSIMPIERVLFRVGTDGVIPAVTATDSSDGDTNH